MAKMCACRIAPRTVGAMCEGDEGYVLPSTVLINKKDDTFLLLKGSVIPHRATHHCVYVKRDCDWYVDVTDSDDYKWSPSYIKRGEVVRVGTLVC